VFSLILNILNKENLMENIKMLKILPLSHSEFFLEEKAYLEQVGYLAFQLKNIELSEGYFKYLLRQTKQGR